MLETLKRLKGNEGNFYIFLKDCLLHMSKEKNNDGVAYIRVSYGNIERIEAICKKGNTFDDAITILLDYYEDLHRQDWVYTRAC